MTTKEIETVVGVKGKTFKTELDAFRYAQKNCNNGDFTKLYRTDPFDYTYFLFKNGNDYFIDFEKLKRPDGMYYIEWVEDFPLNDWQMKYLNDHDSTCRC